MKIMLDECILKRPAYAIIEFLKVIRPDITAHFLIDFLGHEGELDENWAPQCVPPEDWIVITADSGRSAPRIKIKGAPLHLVLPQAGITGFFMCGKTLTQSSGREKARVIIALLPRILRIAEAEKPGCRFKIRRQGQDGIVVEPWPLKKTKNP